MMLGTHSPSPPSTMAAPGILAEGFDPARHTRCKRKAESQDNDRERLSKRLSLLNIEKKKKTTTTMTKKIAHDDSMQVDDSKTKVFIHNIDDELSSDSENEEGKLVFLPDIEKHLRETRIPRHILANDDGELAGMQLVLYSDPKSLSVPEEKDVVRKAILEARHRAREKQKEERQGTRITIGSSLPPACGVEFGGQAAVNHAAPVDDGYDAMDVD